MTVAGALDEGLRIVHEDYRDLIKAALAVSLVPMFVAMYFGTAAAETEEAAAEQAEALLALGPTNVLVKGGHGTGDDSVDILIGKDGCRERLVAPRIATQNTHGTGCTLSSAIASGLAHGIALNEAVALAKRYISAAIAASDTVKVGHGHGPVHHFHHWWDRPDGSKP